MQSNLGDFLESLRSTNPFEVNKIGPATFALRDADGVHGKPYRRLIDLANRTMTEGVAFGATLWGEAGIGKSHLLARLSNWAEHDKQGVYVYLSNLQAAPEQLPRTVLRNLIGYLTRGRTEYFQGTPLYKILNATIQFALNDDGEQLHAISKAKTAYVDLIDDYCANRPSHAVMIDRPTYEVLWRFFLSSYQAAHHDQDDGLAALAVRWLGGDALDVGEARQLGLPVGGAAEDGVALADDEQIKKALIAIAQLASYWRRPLMICLDQVDNLEPEQFSSLARFLHALLDSAVNLLIVTTGVKDTLARWEAHGVVTKATWDRLAQHVIELQRISLAEARQIVQARLMPMQEPFQTDDPIKKMLLDDYLFPLGEKWAKRFLGDKIDVRPRDVINWAHEGWRCEQERLAALGNLNWLTEWQGGVERKTISSPDATEIENRIDAKIAFKIREHVEQRRLAPHTLPPDGDNLAGLLFALLARCVNLPQEPSLLAIDRQQKPKYGPKPAVQLVLHRRDGLGEVERVALLCIVVGNRNSISAHLRRLAQDVTAFDQLFLVTDGRRPLDPAAAGQGYLAQLQLRFGKRLHRVELSFDAYARLEALQAVVGLARSGDLEIDLNGGEARRVTEAEVLASHLRHNRYRDEPLLRELLNAAMERVSNGVAPLK